jgi:hypothetical protein
MNWQRVVTRLVLAATVAVTVSRVSADEKSWVGQRRVRVR